MLLSALIFAPLLGAIVVMLLPRENKRLIRYVATGFTAVPLAIGALMVGLYRDAAVGDHGLKFVENHAWMPNLGVN